MTGAGVDRPARILWVINGLARGGAEQLLTQTARRLDRDRFRVVAVRARSGDDAMVADLEAAGVRCLDLGVPSIRDPRWVQALARVVRGLRPDLIHCHSPVVGAAARLLATKGVPVVQHEHSVWSLHHPVTRWLERRTYGRVAASLATSTAVATDLARWVRPGVDVTVVNPGLDLGDWAVRQPADVTRARALLGLPSTCRVVGSVGNLTSLKDHATLLRAVAGLPHGDVHVIVVGFGPQREALVSLAITLGIADRLHLTGSTRDVGAVLPAFDVYVQTSRSEGFGIAALEAMATGIPVVASRVGGLAELVEGGAGLAVGPGDVAGFSSAIAGVLENPDAAAEMARRARGVAESHPIGPYVEVIDATYRRLLAP
ncbi:MAG TPA: glycosyltransferase [Euzebya sp.]|nr:glycosyltransferase [Euzebya sp.]